jgi:phage shock protein PspC (stress-responsive transcriptional regulator)
MENTLNINISGTLFQIEENAYKVLRDYLQAINNRFKNVAGGIETIEDIEFRIAEIFSSQKNNAGIISLENVEAMISVLGRPEDFDNSDATVQPQGSTATRKRLYRNPDDKIISGVCGGIGAYLNTDPVLFRVLFVIFTLSFGAGILVYLALWISLPPADNETRRRELFGSGTGRNKKHLSGLGSAIDEVFRALARVLFIFVRIFLIIIGVFLVITGALLIMSIVMLLVFKYPASISGSAFDMDLINLPAFLSYTINPAVVPWIMGLSVVIFIIPMLALIYWGVKMIFWFRARDAVFSLVAFVLWIILIAALAVILFNEGISFAETVKTSEQKMLPARPDTLYIRTAHRVSDLKPGKELSFRADRYSVLINEEKGEIYIRPWLKVYDKELGEPRVELRKRTSGRNESEAMKKAGEIMYEYSINGDTLVVDDYFTLPAGRKWAADNLGLNIYLPVGTVLRFDQPSLRLLHQYISKEYYDVDREDISTEFGNTWILTREGLEPADTGEPGKK